jgi:putative ABC transport system substrate-binding protein
LGPKRLELLREVVPSATVIGVLINPSSATLEAVLRDSPPAARSLGIQLVFLNASTVQEIDTAFEAIAQQGITALAVTNDAFLISRRDQIIGLAARHSLPTIYAARETITAGGLISYSPEIGESHRQAGIYTGRILKGEKPADLPVLQPTKFELLINLRTAKVLGLEIPSKLLALADEVIE